jgi:hypothetical protein
MPLLAGCFVVEGRGQDPQDARSVVSREALSFDVLVLVAH